MKTGVIVYVVGKESLDDTIDFEEAGKRLNIKADKVEVVSSIGGNFDVMDAWWLLTVKGMKRIICMIAEVINRSELKLTGQELRLCG
jgi:3-mercaptopyruvate sulfurtransferase SseA